MTDLKGSDPVKITDLDGREKPAGPFSEIDGFIYTCIYGLKLKIMFLLVEKNNYLPFTPLIDRYFLSILEL